MRGTPETMQSLTDYPDGVTAEVLRYFQEFAIRAAEAGIEDWVLDPGFGFAKTVEQNWTLLVELDRLQVLRHPILVGISRKSMIYKRFGITPEESLPATQVAHYMALERGATYLRVHDVAEARRTVSVYTSERV
jgi:dihydropteroate synthase